MGYGLLAVMVLMLLAYYAWIFRGINIGVIQKASNISSRCEKYSSRSFPYF